MNPRITLAVVAAALAILMQPAEARRNYTATQQFNAGMVDVAAIPAYPYETQQVPRATSRARAHEAPVVLASLSGPAAGSAAQRPSVAVPMGTPEIRPNRHGMVEVMTAYGRKIEVNPIDASKFVKFFQLLHEAGYRFDWDKYVGCYSPGHKPGSNHRIGRACDIQTDWNRGPSFVYHMDKFVKAAGLYNGCSFGDCGHVEAVRGLHNPRPNLAMAMEKFHGEIAERQDEAKAFAEHAALILPEAPREQKVKAEPKKKREVSRGHKRRYARHHRTRVAAG